MRDVRFDEVMSGWVSFTERDHNQALVEGRRAGRRMTLRLHLELDRVADLEADPATPLRASGVVELPELGPPMHVVEGTLQLFVGEPDTRHAKMRYRLRCRTGAGDVVTISGFKLVEDDSGFDTRTDMSTLFVRVFRGWVPEPADERAADVIATGVLTLSPLGFVRMMGGMQGRKVRFVRQFIKGTVDAYVRGEPGDTRPDFPDDLDWRDVPLRNGLQRRLVTYWAGGERLTLHHLRRPGAAADRGPVVLVHGAASRPNLFYGAPMRTTIADALLDAGYDVWVQGWRASIDDHPRRWCLDEAAAYDHPAAIAKVAEETGAQGIRVVAHCQGASSYTIALVAGLLPQVTHFFANAVTLHPTVPLRSRLKTAALLPGLRATTPYLDSQWGNRAPHAYARSIALMARAFRGRDCDDAACQLTQFSYGTGPDLLWQHALLEQDVHHFLSREFGYVPIRFFRQIYRSERAGHLVPFAELPDSPLPSSYVGTPKRPMPRTTFACGTNNRVFLPAGQLRSYAHFNAYAPGVHQHLDLPRYGHADVWLGRDSAREVFPRVLDALTA